MDKLIFWDFSGNFDGGKFAWRFQVLSLNLKFNCTNLVLRSSNVCDTLGVDFCSYVNSIVFHHCCTWQSEQGDDAEVKSFTIKVRCLSHRLIDGLPRDAFQLIYSRLKTPPSVIFSIRFIDHARASSLHCCRAVILNFRNSSLALPVS